MAKVTNIMDAARTMRRKGRSKKGCTICGKPVVEAHRPFCSKRCAQIDLGRWLGGRYRIETEEGPEGEASPDADAHYTDRLDSED